MTTTDKAKFVIDVRSLKEFTDYVGITAHTVYKRLSIENWKASERLAIETFYKKIQDHVKREDIA